MLNIRKLQAINIENPIDSTIEITLSSYTSMKKLEGKRVWIKLKAPRMSFVRYTPARCAKANSANIIAEHIPKEIDFDSAFRNTQLQKDRNAIWQNAPLRIPVHNPKIHSVSIILPKVYATVAQRVENKMQYR